MLILVLSLLMTWTWVFSDVHGQADLLTLSTSNCKSFLDDARRTIVINKPEVVNNLALYFYANLHVLNG